MASIECCGCYRSANSHRLASNDPAYTFQRFYPLKSPCPVCGLKTQKWRGEAPDGTLSPFYDIDPGAFAAWLRRVIPDKARPEAQFMSEWAHKVASGNMDGQIQYQTKLCQAHRWYRGERV